MLVTTSGDCSAKIWKTSDWTLLRELRHDSQRWVWDAAFSADSRYLFTGEIHVSKIGSIKYLKKILLSLSHPKTGTFLQTNIVTCFWLLQVRQTAMHVYGKLQTVHWSASTADIRSQSLRSPSGIKSYKAGAGACRGACH